jgi:hypothetical protein
VTTATAAGLNPTEAKARVNALLDLSNVRAKLADPEEGKGYGSEQLDLIEGEYRKFLALRLIHPDIEIVPCKIVDEIWHQHILDTAAYRIDCQALFGEFLDHYPYFGMNGPEDAQALEEAANKTAELYEAAFGSPPDDTWVASDAARCKRPTCRW